MDRQTGDISYILAQKQELAERVEQDILNTTERMKDILEKTDNLVDTLQSQLDDEYDVRTAAVLSGTLKNLTQQLKIGNELMGTLKPMPHTLNQSVTFNIIDTSLKVVQELKKLERLGYIKILKEISG